MKWFTFPLENGDIILSHKALSRLGNKLYSYEFTIMTKEAPYFMIKTGSEIGGEEKEYLKMKGIY